MFHHPKLFLSLAITVLLTAACSAQTTTTAPASQPAADPNTVAIDNFTFAPQSLTISAGTTITWINHDDIPHTATSAGKVDGKRIFNSGVLDTDQKFSFTFKTPGTYHYFCTVHPHMTATIIVK